VKSLFQETGSPAEENYESKRKEIFEKSHNIFLKFILEKHNNNHKIELRTVANSIGLHEDEILDQSGRVLMNFQISLYNPSYPIIFVYDDDFADESDRLKRRIEKELQIKVDNQLI